MTDIVIYTLHSGTEVQLPFRFYEGATTIAGTVNGISVTGIGFAELLHSYENPEIVITNTSIWNPATPLIWQIDNADDGNPLKYDLEYSIDNQQTFLPIASQLTDTFYYWNTSPIPNGDTCWIRVTGYSIDSTLYNSEIAALIVNGNNTPVQEIGLQKQI